MRHFPIFLDTRGRGVVVSGAGACAAAKLRLLLKTEARLHVYGAQADAQVQTWAQQGRLTLHNRPVTARDLTGAALLYAANDDPALDDAVARLGRAAGVKTLVVDNLEASDFITPALVDRAPVTVAIGTEGTAPVLARQIKARVEAMLPANLGLLARVAEGLRPMVGRLTPGRARRDLWARFYADAGPKALSGGAAAVRDALHDLLVQADSPDPQKGHVHFVGAGPGDPDLLTLKARKLLHQADVVIYDRLVSGPIVELARREAVLMKVGKTPFGPSWKQGDINALLVKHGVGAQVVRLKSGDGGIFGRMDEETAALDQAGIDYSVTPGITAAAAAAAELKVSLTQRGRNTGVRIITGHDADGFAEQDWRALAQPGAVAAIYMGKAAAGVMRGRLLMQGAAGDTPVTIVEHASRPEQRIIPATLLSLQDRLTDVTGPAVLMLGLAPRAAAQAALREAL